MTFINRPPLSLILLLLLTVKSGWAQEVTKGASPLLNSADVPGFHLHSVYQVRCELGGMREQWPGVDWDRLFPGLTERVLVKERWMTLTRDEYKRYVRQHASPPSSGNAIFIDWQTLPNATQAANFARLLVNGRPEATLPGVGQCWVLERRSQGRYSFDIVFAHGRTALKISSDGADWDRPRAESLVRAVLTRLDQGRTALQVQAQVLSKHVKPHKNERAEVKITSNTSPTSYLIQVKRQGQVVYQTQVSGQTGPYLFVWNGLTNNGQQASNGDHDVLVTATDSFSRTATQTVKIVVNFQGK